MTLLDFIQANYQEYFDEYKLTNDYRTNNAYWFIQTHLVSLLNSTTSLKVPCPDEFALKAGEFICKSLEFYMVVKIHYPFNLYKTMQKEKDQASPTEKSETSPEISEKEKNNMELQVKTHITRSIILGVDVCRSLTTQKHELYQRCLVFSRDTKMANAEMNYYAEIMEKHPNSTWSEDCKNCIVSTPKAKVDIFSKLCCKVRSLC